MKVKLLIFLLFSTSSYVMSQVGINTENPLSELHIVPASGQDPLILSNLKNTDDTPNDLDGTTPSYSNLKISANGVVRREQAASANQSAIVNLATAFTVPAGGSNGSGGQTMNWYLADGTRSNYITLPETGAYVFSFRLYGSITSINTGSTHYISSWKNSETTPFDIAEIYITSVGASTSTTVATYSVNLTASGNAGDKIYFKISYYTTIGWALRAVTSATTGNVANKTSMLYWKL